MGDVTAADADKDVLDLVDFLRTSNVNTQVKQAAAQIVEGLSGSQDGIDKLAPAAASLLPALLSVAPAEGGASGSALTGLVNLSQDMRFSGELVRLGAVARCMDWLREGRTVQHVDLVTKLLCNVTTLEQGSTDLLQLGEGDLEGFNMAVLLSKFIEGSAEDWDYVAAVLTNVTRMPDGRKLLLDPQRGFLRALATQLRSPSLTRRRGCAAAFRNCAFGAQKERDGTEGWIAEQPAVLSDVLDVLCGVTGERDGDDTVRESLADAVFLLVHSDVTRQALVDSDAAASLEKAYQQEESAQVLSAMEGCFQSLLQPGSSAASSPGRWRPLPTAPEPA